MFHEMHLRLQKCHKWTCAAELISTPRAATSAGQGEACTVLLEDAIAAAPVFVPINPVQQANVQVTITGGSGAVRSSPAGINCSSPARQGQSCSAK
jgi:hypothetical protein